jgi:hypothetical protein
MKAKRLLTTVVIVVNIIFLMNNGSFAGNLDDLRRAIKDAIAKHAEDAAVIEGTVGVEDTESIAAMSIVERTSLSCNKQIALNGFCIENMTPIKGHVFPLEGGHGEIIVRHNFPNIAYPVRPISSALYFASNSSSVKIVSKDMLDLTHTKVSYEVLPFAELGSESSGRAVVSDAGVGSITIGKWGKRHSRKIDIFRESIDFRAP